MTSSESSEPTIIDGKKYRSAQEGLASILAAYAEEKPASGKPSTGKKGHNNDEGNQAVFYNPIQQFNRDLTVLAITVYGEGAQLEKEERFRQKTNHGKGKKQKRREPSTAKVDETESARSEPEQSNALKRKANKLDEENSDPLTSNASKRPKSTAEPEDGEDDPMVMELTADPAAGQEHDEQQQQRANTNGVTEGNGQGGPSTIDPTTPTKKQLPFTILDALSATGLRALRYAKEIPFATNVVANDILPESVRNIELNIQHNQIQDKVHSNLGDARAFMYSKVGNEKRGQSPEYVHRFDVIDLDPYGTAAPFLDAGLQALQDGGMLCVTCTDAGVFASVGYPEKTYALYGGMPIKGPHSHEGGLRLILNAVALSAAKYGLAIEPLLSLYIDYYARLFIRVHRKQQDVKLLAGTTMTVYNCGHGCGAWTTQPLLRNQAQVSRNGETFFKFSFAQAPSTTPNCEHCGSKTHLCGPMWAGPLHNPYFVQRMLNRVPSLDKTVYGTTERMQGMLTLALEEDLTLSPQNRPDASTTTSTASASTASAAAPDPRIIPRLPPTTIDNSPFFIMPTQLAKVIHCATPSEDMMRGALLGLGYRVSRSHCKPGSIKTNAPWSVLWEIIREFMRTKAPIKEGAVKQGSAGYNILARVRGTERAQVAELKDTVKDQLVRCDTKDDLKTVLQGMLWKLENGKPASTSAVPGQVRGEGEAEADDSGSKSSAAQPPANNGVHGKTETKAGSIDQGEGVEGGDKSKPLQNGGSRFRSRSPSPSKVSNLSKLNIVFDEKLGRERRQGKLVRYQMNPRENWGPMSRAGRTG
ncbi:tRNA (guanine(26)-N(2))-dimethyltransferase [Exophiala dermatitidis]